MKKSVKALLLVACAIVLVVATVFTTLAYMTSQTGTIKNTFTVGNVAIELDEAKVDAVGNVTEGRVEATAGGEQSQSYKLIPGKSFVKDPTVTVLANSENSYVFVEVKKDTRLNALVTGLEIDIYDAETNPNGIWAKLDGKDDIYYLRANYASNAVDQKYEVFKTIGATENTFTVNTDADLSVITGENDPTVTVMAYAIQMEEIANVDAAWAALSAAQA